MLLSCLRVFWRLVNHRFSLFIWLALGRYRLFQLFTAAFLVSSNMSCLHTSKAWMRAVPLFQQSDTVPWGCITVSHQHLFCYKPLKWAGTRPSLHPLLCCITDWCCFSPLLLHPSSSHTLLCHALHTFVILFYLLSLRSWSNQCWWWIIHSELCRLKLFDWQLYSHVSYIINLALLGIAAMVKAIIGQGKASVLMEWIPPPIAYSLSFSLSFITPSLFPCVLSFPFHFGGSSWRSPLANITEG